MTANFCVLILLLSLVCYATLGGRNENDQSIEESVIIEQIIEEPELITEETQNEFETEFLEETEYIASCPAEEVEDVLEIMDTPLECPFRKSKRLAKSPISKRCSKVKSTPCPCYVAQDTIADDLEMGHAECTTRVSNKPRIIKRIIKKVPSAKYAMKDPELETYESPLESSTEQIIADHIETPAEETKKNEKHEKQPKVQAVKDKSEKLQQDKPNKQAKQKNNQKLRSQTKGKAQKSHNKPKSNKKTKQ